MSRELTIDVAKGCVMEKAKQFQAALKDRPQDGLIKPVGWEPWYAAVIADFQREPKLIEAAAQAPDTVWECLSHAASLALIPGGASGKFYLIPRWNGKQSRMTCTFIVGYKGLAELAYRHPRVHKCEAFVVYEGEEFDFDPGRSKLVHRWNPKAVRTDDKIVAAYSRVSLTVPNGSHVDEEPLVCAMTIDEIKAIRARSQAAKAGFSPWQTDFAAMCRKTPMRRHMNGGSVPQSSDLIMAIAADIHEERMVEESMKPAEAAQASSAGLRGALGLDDPDYARDIETAARIHAERGQQEGERRPTGAEGQQ